MFLVVIGLLSCAPPRHDVGPGYTTDYPEAQESQPKTEPEAQPKWAHFQTLLSAPPLTAEPFRSRGHAAGRYLVSIHVSAGLEERYRTRQFSEPLPDGAVIAKFHYDDAKQLQQVYAIERKDSQWSFVVADSDGTLIEEGDLPLCVRCHADAPSPPLFGLPRDLESNALETKPPE